MALPTHTAFTIAFLIGIVPAITLLYYTLKEYESTLKDELLFFSILTGLFLGIVVSFFHLVISAELPYLNIITLVLVVVSFALFENIVKVVFVQLRRFGAEFTTTYYGATFGIIVGASITMGRTYEFFSSDLAVVEMVGIVIFALAIIFMNGATGAWIGFGHHDQNLRWSLISAILVSIPFNLLVFWWYLFHYAFEPDFEDLTLIGGALAYAVFVFMYSYFRIMPEALPEKERRKRLRERRKAASR